MKVCAYEYTLAYECDIYIYIYTVVHVNANANVCVNVLREYHVSPPLHNTHLYTPVHTCTHLHSPTDTHPMHPHTLCTPPHPMYTRIYPPYLPTDLKKEVNIDGVPRAIGMDVAATLDKRPIWSPHHFEEVLKPGWGERSMFQDAQRALTYKWKSGMHVCVCYFYLFIGGRGGFGGVVALCMQCMDVWSVWSVCSECNVVLYMYGVCNLSHAHLLFHTPHLPFPHTGPWEGLLNRRGYDPRNDQQARAYQAFVYQVPPQWAEEVRKANTSFSIQTVESAVVTWPGLPPLGVLPGPVAEYVCVCMCGEWEGVGGWGGGVASGMYSGLCGMYDDGGMLCAHVCFLCIPTCVCP